MFKKLNQPINVSLINRLFFPNDLDEIEKINKGRCFIWAYIAYQSFSNLEIWSMGSHAFVRSSVNKLFYDAEIDNGVDDWRDLPATNFGQGCGKACCKHPAEHHHCIEQFKYLWRGAAQWYDINWEKLDKHIKKKLKCDPIIKQSLSV